MQQQQHHEKRTEEENEEEERVVLLLGLQYSGKTMFGEFLFDGTTSYYRSTHGFKETLIENKLGRHLLIEYGGTVIEKWKYIFKNAAYRRRVSHILLFLDGSFDCSQIEQTRCAYMCLLYYFKELHQVPLCVVQHHASANDPPVVEWSLVKKILQLRLLIDRGFCSENIVVIRLVYSEYAALEKNTQRILEWISNT